MSGRASGKPRLTSAEEADLLPSTKTAPAAIPIPPPPPRYAAAQSLLPPELELPPGEDLPSPGGIEATILLQNVTEATTAWSAPPATPPPPARAPQADIRSGQLPPLVTNQNQTQARRLSPEERAQFRFWKNLIVFGLLVGILLILFAMMARQ
jgi:hypothetical protein